MCDIVCGFGKGTVTEVRIISRKLCVSKRLEMASKSKIKRAVDVGSEDLTTGSVCFDAFNNDQHKQHLLPVCTHFVSSV
jgi:hypothetical protein